MKKIIIIAAAILLTASLSFAQQSDLKAGSIAPELVGNNPDGKQYSLKEINKDRYVLIDFWASWCRPCRIANPALVKSYQEYSKKKYKNAKRGFTIVSVSLDMQSHSWEMAIDKDKLEWEYHISDLKGWDSELAASYNIQAIPQIVLLGPDGKIIGTYMESATAFAALDKYVQ